MNNYTGKGYWKYDGFKTFERKMLEKTKLDLGLVDDLAMLTIQECKDYLSKLDIIATGTKVTDLRSALRESYTHGRKLLNIDNGTLLMRQRKIFIYAAQETRRFLEIIFIAASLLCKTIGDFKFYQIAKAFYHFCLKTVRNNSLS